MGETRAPSIVAGKLDAGNMMTRPRMCSGCNSRMRRDNTICPSYSSPWLPDIRNTVGPGPLRTTVMGMAMVP